MAENFNGNGKIKPAPKYKTEVTYKAFELVDNELVVIERLKEEVFTDMSSAMAALQNGVEPGEYVLMPVFKVELNIIKPNLTVL